MNILVFFVITKYNFITIVRSNEQYKRCAMLYITTAQAAENWGVTPRRIQDMCKANLIEGAVRHGREWMIPADAHRPPDRRRKEAVPAAMLPNLPRRNPAIIMTNLYSAPGTADSVAASLMDMPETAALFLAQLEFCRGNINVARNMVLKILESPCGHDLQIGCGLILALCGMFKSDHALWRKGRQYICDAVCRNPKDVHLSEFWVAAMDSEIYDTESFPEWFLRGCFDPLPGDSYPAARFYYLKSLYFLCHESAVGHRGERDSQSMMRIFPLIAEPLISQTKKDGALLAEIYLRLICAVAYHNLGKDALAIGQLDTAIALALPDRLYLILAEYRKDLDFLMDERLNLADPASVATVRSLGKQYAEGWTVLHNTSMGRTVSTRLSTREREVAKYAAYGLSNKEIATRLNISLNTVKQSLRTAMDKTGAQRRSDLSRFL